MYTHLLERIFNSMFFGIQFNDQCCMGLWKSDWLCAYTCRRCSGKFSSIYICTNVVRVEIYIFWHPLKVYHVVIGVRQKKNIMERIFHERDRALGLFPYKCDIFLCAQFDWFRINGERNILNYSSNWLYNILLRNVLSLLVLCLFSFFIFTFLTCNRTILQHQHRLKGRKQYSTINTIPSWLFVVFILEVLYLLSFLWKS